MPHKFKPRDYQLPLLEAFDKGFTRLVQVWNRRSGKDKVCLNIVAREMALNVGNYYYLYPTYEQGRKALWENRGSDGIKYLEHFPKELIKRQNDHEMKIEFKNGSIFRVIGVEDPDKVVGPNPRGVVFSEYSLQNPQAWELFRPILAENKGWAIFNFTPRGRNHGYKMYEMAKGNPMWFVEKLTVDDTKDHSGNPIFSPEQIQGERDSGMDEDLIQQEYYCDFNAPLLGSYYGKYISKADKEGRITDVDYEETEKTT